MKLKTLLNSACDEMWLCIVDGNGVEHYLWSADYVGYDPDVMTEFEPFLNRTFDGFDLVQRPDPDRADRLNAAPVPMLYVELDKTSKELADGRALVEQYEAVQKAYSDIVEATCAVENDLQERYFCLFETDAGWLIFGNKAPVFAEIVDRVILSVCCTAVVCIPKRELMVSVQKCLNAGLSVAICRRTKGKIVRYKSIVLAYVSDDLNRIKKVESE